MEIMLNGIRASSAASQDSFTKKYSRCNEMNATVINAKNVRLLCCRVSGHWSSVISCYFSIDQNMTGLNVCPGENKTYDSVRLNQMVTARTSNSELNAKKV